MAKLAAPLQARLRGREILPVIVQGRRSEGATILDLVQAAFDVPADGLGLDFVSAILPRDAVLAIAGDRDVLRVYLDRPVSIPEAVASDPFSILGLARELVPRLGTRPRDLRNRIAAKRSEWVPTSQSRRFVGAHRAQEVGVDGRGVRIAVVDTDASPRFANHPQLRGKAETYTVRGPIATDTNGHGGHVAMTAAGRRATSPLGIEVEGVAPGATVIGVKALYTPMGTGMESDIIRGIVAAVDRGARVVNMSLGSQASGSPADDASCQAIRRLADRAVFVAASGNDGPDPGSVDSPGHCSGVLAVGAVDARTGGIADFSSRGPAAGGVTKPDFAMPGVNIYSGLTPRTVMDRVGDLVSEGFGPLSGTSMATPHLAGMVAIAMQALERDGDRVTVETLHKIGAEFGHTKSNVDGYGPLTWGMIERYA